MKYLFFIVFFIISFNAFSQSNGYVNDFIDHWEDNFWWNETVERCYKEHTKAGEYVKYYKNGKIKWKGSCNDDGTPIRTWYYYNEKGELLWEGEYNGKFVEYYSYDGEKQDTALIGSYKDGLKNGEWIYYDNNYQGHYLSKKGNYLSGEPTGVWQHFKPLTFVTKTEKYQEYNYATETLTFFEKDSIKTKHIDSLNYDPEDYYNYRDDESNIQHFIFEFYHSTHVVDFKKVNDFYYDTISKKSLQVIYILSD